MRAHATKLFVPSIGFTTTLQVTGANDQAARSSYPSLDLDAWPHRGTS
jgi:hypothetical protein